ncbi:hypothetical protein N9L68_05495, partial [bacterium]|nr:hypothetical protein [bacterium]
GPTCERRLTFEQLSELQSACVNAYAVAVCVQGDGFSRRVAHIIQAFTGLRNDEHADANKRQRCVEAYSKLFFEKVDGGYMKTANKFVDAVASRDLLFTAVFQGVMVPSCDPDDIGAEVEPANFVARFCFTIVKNFINRMIYLGGLPYKFCSYLRGERYAVEYVTSFKADLASHKEMTGLPDQCHKAQRINKRSLFNNTSVQPYVQACSDPEPAQESGDID